MASSLRAVLLGEILLLQLESPDGYPRLERALLEHFHGQLDEIAADAAIRGVVLTGTSLAFAVGADLEEVSALRPTDALRFSALGQGLMRKIELLKKPVVAAVNGYCLGGGFDLALACHRRIAAANAVFGHPGCSLGILTGWGGTARLPRLAGRARALEILASGRSITAAEAFEWDLVSCVVSAEQLLDDAVALARNLHAKPVTV